MCVIDVVVVVTREIFSIEQVKQKNINHKIQDCCEDQYPVPSLLWIGPLRCQLVATLPAHRRSIAVSTMTQRPSPTGRLYLFRFKCVFGSTHYGADDSVTAI